MAKYFDVHPQTPQARTIGTVVDSLRTGALIAYPTDSCFASAAGSTTATASNGSARSGGSTSATTSP